FIAFSFSTPRRKPRVCLPRTHTSIGMTDEPPGHEVPAFVHSLDVDHLRLVLHSLRLYHRPPEVQPRASASARSLAASICERGRRAVHHSNRSALADARG